MKKVLALTVALVGLVPNTLAFFNDVNSKHLYYDAIDYIEQEGIVEGYADGNFRPGKTINRAEFTKIIIEATISDEEIETCQKSEIVLFDILSYEWYAPYICVAVNKGIVGGYDDGTFKPAEPINFAEASKIIVNAMGIEVDTSTNIWYQHFVEGLAMQNAIPTEIQGFDKHLTRGQMAEMIYRIMADVKTKDSHSYESLGGDKPLPRQEAFSNIGLKTNTAISSIPLSDVLGGGPTKDGIPAILEPTFTSIKEAEEWLDEEALGIIYEGRSTTRFYPYAILYWHEITNDTVDGKNLAVTFCPLCGSAIIFDRGQDVFGVSGKLWESNLLMYDKKTETLWSQIIGEAMVGDRTGEILEILDANVISFAELKERYQDAEVLSKETGYTRNYGQSPYGDYETNNSLYFPVSSEDESFHKKELFYIVNVGDVSVGFMRSELLQVGLAKVKVADMSIKAEVIGESEITITNESTGEEIPGYIAMWFSWVTHSNKERIVWSN